METDCICVGFILLVEVRKHGNTSYASFAIVKEKIDVQDFVRIYKDGKYYVDYTELICKMVHADDYYFLSRPR